MTDPAGDRAVNRTLWTLVNEEFTDQSAATAWSAPEITWGLFDIAERDVDALGDVADLDVLELGCGTAYFSSWLARRGARPVALDLTAAQLATARRCQQQFDLAFPLIEADAEDVPLADDRFDLVVSEYGASVWCDPDRWVPEAARLLRTGGRLVFLTNSVIATLCVPEEEGLTQARLLRAQRGLNRVRWPGGGIEFHPGHGEWIRILRASGFSVDALHELYAPIDADRVEYYEITSAQWAAQWPIDDLWVARLRD
jgi:SAM-dependent methyltransferase